MLVRRNDLIGLILAGGKSRRVGRDKAFMLYKGKPVYQHMHALLLPFCKHVFISCRKDQSHRFQSHRVLVDTENDIGPIAGLLAAWKSFPNHALLVLAVDMPRVDHLVLEQLIEGRNYQNSVTCFRSPTNDMIEPLCTIYEHSFLEIVEEKVEGRKYSLSKLIMELKAKKTIVPCKMDVLKSFNHPEDWEIQD
jgi:molybdopterin-guanine dinucleotide biosynthesis protein A